MRETIIIAEAGVNHNGNLELAKQLIDVGAEAGADYVKFQTFKAEKIVSREAQMAPYQAKNIRNTAQSQYEMIKKLELDPAAHEQLIIHCQKKGTRFLSTPFDLESVDLLDSFGLDYFKVPSGDITNLPLLQKIGSIGKPIILSTGMANLGEIEAALEVLKLAGAAKEKIIVLHCNTEYPTPMKDVNLRAMLSIRDAFKVEVGYSDHTLGIEVPIAAVALGAVCIEKHFTLDRNLPGPDHQASLDPEELKEMITNIRNIEKALGTGIKAPSLSEQKNIAVARKSIHLAKNLVTGHILQKKDLLMKRPGNGISPMMLDLIIGRKLKQPRPADHKLSFKDLQ